MICRWAAGFLIIATSAGVAEAQQTYVDPFNYCEAKVTIDAPAPDWIGDAVPEAVLNGLRQAAELGPAMSDEQLGGETHWRCMERQVYACFIGANLPCMEKADDSRTPTPAVNTFCAANPGSENIPAAATGRATLYQWQCVDRTAAVTGTIFNEDPEGFIREFWYPISPNS